MSIEDHKLKPCPFCGNDGESIFEFAHCSNKTCVGFDMVATKQQWNARNQDKESLVSDIEALIDQTNSNLAKYELRIAYNRLITGVENLINQDKEGS